MLCLHFPQLLSSPELRPHYPMHTMPSPDPRPDRCGGVIRYFFLLIRKKKVLALTGMLLAIAAAALGGASVPINQTWHDGPAIGLDWFLLDMFLMALIYVPIERLWPQYPIQGTFRDQWTLDVVYFMSTHLPIQILSFLVLLPATQAVKYPGRAEYRPCHRPHALAAAVLFGDRRRRCRGMDSIHWALHRVPFLWRFHSIHHSSKALDWIAGSRSHFCGRHPGAGIHPGSPDAGLFAKHHLGVSDFRDPSRHVDPLQFSPQCQMARAISSSCRRYHHWHHSSQKEAIDKNFAIHFPWIDRLFGTHYYPEEWPARYGLDAEEIPKGFIRQTYEPFIKKNVRILKI